MTTTTARLGFLTRFLAALIWLAPTAALGESADSEQSVLLATTTSVRDSGLLDVLLPPFTHETGITVRTVAVGTGAALRMGAEGNADILLTHAPESEKALLASGSISERREIMDNYFVIAGPENDVAGVAATDHIDQAMNRIRTQQANFVSRADDSGTH
ncbi:MAG: substrate-binding domain-containing protein, partial [Myxococcota bacterium]